GPVGVAPHERPLAEHLVPPDVRDEPLVGLSPHVPRVRLREHQFPRVAFLVRRPHLVSSPANLSSVRVLRRVSISRRSPGTATRTGAGRRGARCVSRSPSPSGTSWRRGGPRTLRSGSRGWRG